MLFASLPRQAAARILSVLIVLGALFAAAAAFAWIVPVDAPVLGPAARSVLRTFAVLSAIPSRDARCSIANGWAATADEVGRLTRQIFQGMRVLETDGRLTLVETCAGRFWIPRGDNLAVAEEIAEQRLGIYGADVRQGDLVLDCGANVGVFTRKALEMGAGRVIAIELAPDAIECLQRTFEQEAGRGRVTIYPKGVWEKETNLRLTTGPLLASSANSVAVNRGLAGPEVAVTTIDKIVADLGLSRVDFIKMDIEGSERQALRGAAHTLVRHKPRLAVSLEHQRSDPDELPALVQSLNPTYLTHCRACGFTTGRLQPEVLLAW